MTRLRALILLASAALAAACGPSTGRSNPVVLIGVDGLDPDVIQELLAQDRLPNIARFADEGVLARLRTMDPTLSPVLWTTIATGVPPEEHGITDFQDEGARPFTSNARRAPALWDIVSHRGRTVNCVGWWVTWPAEAVNGNMVASYAAQAQASVVWKPGTWEKLRDQTWPADLVERTRPLMVFADDAEEIRNRLWERFPRPAELNDVTRDSVTILGWTYAADLSFTRIAEELLTAEPADLNMVYTALPDVAGHRFWSYYRPQDFPVPVSEERRAYFGEYVELAYVEADRLIGELLAAIPADANVLLVSDHGMAAFAKARNKPERPVSGHHDSSVWGVIGALGPAIRPAGNQLGRWGESPQPLGELLDVAPLVLRLMDEPIPGHWPKARASAGVDGALDESWAAAHPPRTIVDDRAWFREPTESIVPGKGIDRRFISSFKALGYALSEPEGE